MKQTRWSRLWLWTWCDRRRVEAEVWTSHQGDWIHQEETAAGVWWQAGGGAAEQTAAGEEGEWTHGESFTDTHLSF